MPRMIYLSWAKLLAALDVARCQADRKETSIVHNQLLYARGQVEAKEHAVRANQLSRRAPKRANLRCYCRRSPGGNERVSTSCTFKQRSCYSVERSLCRKVIARFIECDLQMYSCHTRLFRAQLELFTITVVSFPSNAF